MGLPYRFGPRGPDESSLATSLLYKLRNRILAKLNTEISDN